MGWTKRALQNEAYRQYQLNWMIEHDLHAKDLVLSVIQNIADVADPEDPETTNITRMDPEAVFSEWEHDCGFSGSIWACQAEFLTNEYLDKDVVSHLLPADAYAVYLDLWENENLL